MKNIFNTKNIVPTLYIILILIAIPALVIACLAKTGHIDFRDKSIDNKHLVKNYAETNTLYYLPFINYGAETVLGSVRRIYFDYDLSKLDLTKIADGDVLQKIGNFNVQSIQGMSKPTRILINRVTINVKTASGSNLPVSINASTDNNISTSSLITSSDSQSEIAGTGTTSSTGTVGRYNNEVWADGSIPLDFELNTVAFESHVPRIDIPITQTNIYLVAAGAYTKSSSGKGSISIEYTVH